MADGILVNYPHEYAYYNFFAGSGIESGYELDYWDMSFKQAYGLILQDAVGETVKIGTITNPSYWGLESQLSAIRVRWRMRVVPMGM